MYRLKFKDENTRTLTIIIFNVPSSLGRSGRQIQHPRDQLERKCLLAKQMSRLSS